MRHHAKSIKAFIGAMNFEGSRLFYSELGEDFLMVRLWMNDDGQGGSWPKARFQDREDFYQCMVFSARDYPAEKG
jgi:hypothetical protein